MKKQIKIQNIKLRVSTDDIFYLLLIDNPFYYSDDAELNNYEDHLIKNQLCTIKLCPYSNYDNKGVFDYFYAMFNCDYFSENRLHSLINNYSYRYLNKIHLKEIETLLELFVQVHSAILKNINNNDSDFYLDISKEELIKLSINH